MRNYFCTLLISWLCLLCPSLAANCPKSIVIGNEAAESFIRYHGKKDVSLTVFFDEVRVERSSNDHLTVFFPEIHGSSSQPIAFFNQLVVENNRMLNRMEAEMRFEGQLSLTCLRPAELQTKSTITTHKIDHFDLTENSLQLQLTFEKSDGTYYEVVIRSESLYPFSSIPTNLEGRVQLAGNSYPIQSGSASYQPQKNQLLIEGIYDQEGSIRGFGYTIVDFIPQEGSYKIPNYNWKDESAYLLRLNKKNLQWDVEIFKLVKQELPSLSFFPLPEPPLPKVNWKGARTVLKATLTDFWTAPRPQAMIIRMEDFMDQESRIYRQIPPSEAPEAHFYPISSPEYSSAAYSYFAGDTEISRIQYQWDIKKNEGELKIQALETGTSHLAPEVPSKDRLSFDEVERLNQAFNRHFKAYSENDDFKSLKSSIVSTLSTFSIHHELDSAGDIDALLAQLVPLFTSLEANAYDPEFVNQPRPIPEELKNPPFLPAQLRFRSENFQPLERSFQFQDTDIRIQYHQSYIRIIASNPIQGEQDMKLERTEGMYDIHQFHYLISAIQLEDTSFTELVFFDLLLNPKEVTINEEKVTILKIKPVISQLKLKLSEDSKDKLKVVKAQLYGLNNSLIGEWIDPEVPIHYRIGLNRLERADYGENANLKIRYD